MPKKIILVGDVGVGKTSLILNYVVCFLLIQVVLEIVTSSRFFHYKICSNRYIQEGACDENTVATVQFDFVCSIESFVYCSHGLLHTLSFHRFYFIDFVPFFLSTFRNL